MKAIETRYKGYRFRSRLEARWAVFFDALGIKWEYEPEGFVSDDGIMYLPDFYLPDVYLRGSKGTYIEIKPSMDKEFTDQIYSKIDNLQGSNFNLVLMTNTPPGESNGDAGTFVELLPYWDMPMVIVICKQCGCVSIQFWDSQYFQCNSCYSWSAWCSGDSAKYDCFDNAVNAARSARFEFGECGARI